MLCSLRGSVTDAAKDEMESSSGYIAELDVINDVSIWYERELLSSQELRTLHRWCSPEFH